MDLSKYENIPYLAKGRDFNGCDCWGIIYLFYKHNLGIELPTYTTDYMECANKQEIHDLITFHKSHWPEVPKGQEKQEDIINLRIGGKDWHVGVVLSGKRFLHVMKGMNTVIEKYNSVMWKNRIAGFYRYDNK